MTFDDGTRTDLEFMRANLMSAFSQNSQNNVSDSEYFVRTLEDFIDEKIKIAIEQHAEDSKRKVFGRW